jgi:hypothetical protein
MSHPINQVIITLLRFILSEQLVIFVCLSATVSIHSSSTGQGNNISLIMIIVIVIGSCVLLLFCGVSITYFVQYYKRRSENTSELREWISRDGGGEVQLKDHVKGRSFNIASVRYENEYPSTVSIDMDSPMESVSRSI